MDSTELRKKAKNLPVLCRIGKHGLTDQAVKDIQHKLKKKKLVKVKLLRSFLEEHDKKEAAREIAQRTNSQVVSLVGNTLALYKK